MFSQNLIKALHVPVVIIFLNRESNQNVYSGKVSNVNNEFIVKNVRN